MPDFGGFLYNDAGVVRDLGADTVAIFTRNSADNTTATASATALTETNASGYWESLAVADGRYDVRITDGSSVRWRKYDDRVQLREIWVEELQVVNQTNAVSNQVLLLRGNNTTRANNDEVYISLSMEDSGGGETEFARITCLAADITAASEDGRVEIDTMIAGTLTRTHYFEGRNIVVDQVTGDLTLAFTDPAANRTLTFPDPLGNENIMYGPGTIVRRGGTTTEATTTSTTAVSLITLSAPTMAVGDPMRMMASLRKGAGAAASASIGLMMVGTQVMAQAAWSSTVDRAESGLAGWDFVYGTTSYERSSFVGIAQGGTPASAHSAFDTNMTTSANPDVIVRANVGSALITMGVDDVFLYRLPVTTY